MRRKRVLAETSLGRGRPFSFAPLGLASFFRSPPTAGAVGCNLAPLRGCCVLQVSRFDAVDKVQGM